MQCIQLSHKLSQPEKVMPSNICMELVFGCHICQVSQVDSQLSILRVCKVWNAILTAEVRKNWQRHLFHLQKCLQIALPEFQERFNSIAILGQNFRNLMLNYLYHLRTFQENLDGIHSVLKSNCEGALEKFCASSQSVNLKVAFGFTDSMSVLEIQDHFEKYLDKNTALACKKMLDLFCVVKTIQNTTGKYFSLAATPYKITLPNGAHLVKDKKHPLFLDKRLGMLISDFCSAKEQILVLSDIPDELLIHTLQHLISDWDNYEFEIEKLWSYIFDRAGVKKFFMAQALLRVERFAHLGDQLALYKMHGLFKEKKYREQCLDTEIRHLVNIFCSNEHSKVTCIFAVHLMPDEASLLWMTERVFKAADRLLDAKYTAKAIQAIFMIQPLQELPVSEQYQQLLDEFFSAAFLDKLFTLQILLWQNELVALPPKKRLCNLLLKYPASAYPFDLFEHLHQLLGFRYMRFNAIFAEDGLHCLFIKACAKSNQLPLAKAFINNLQTKDECYTTKKIKKTLRSYLKAQRFQI